MISHRNIIANTMQIETYEADSRRRQMAAGEKAVDVNLGLLPMSHIYSLVVVCIAGIYRGDCIVPLTKSLLLTDMI